MKQKRMEYILRMCELSGATRVSPQNRSPNYSVIEENWINATFNHVNKYRSKIKGQERDNARYQKYASR